MNKLCFGFNFRISSALFASERFISHLTQLAGKVLYAYFN